MAILDRKHKKIEVFKEAANQYQLPPTALPINGVTIEQLLAESQEVWERKLNEDIYPCKVCNRCIYWSDFYTDKTGHKDYMCKNCREFSINYLDDKSVQQACMYFNIPFIKKEFNLILENSMKYNNKTKIFGQYLAKMKLAAFRNFNFIDSNELNQEESKMEEIKKDAINPTHYQRESGMECIDEMEMLYGIDEVMIFCKLNAHKYRYRAADKNGVEDLKKSDWYMNKYLELKNRKQNTITFTNSGIRIDPYISSTTATPLVIYANNSEKDN